MRSGFSWWRRGGVQFFIALADEAYSTMTTLAVELDAVLTREAMFRSISLLPARGRTLTGVLSLVTLHTKRTPRPHAVWVFRFLVEANLHF